MDRVIPFHPGCSLGFGVDVTQFPFQCGKQISGNLDPIYAQPLLTTAQFSFIESRRDVCDILNIPPEYALKVESSIVPNPLVSQCLRAAEGVNDYQTAIIFRINFLQQKIYLPETARIIKNEETECVAEDNENKDTTSKSKESASAVPSVEKKCYTHIVNAVEVGNELIAILKISSDDHENFTNISSKLKEVLKHSRGVLDAETLSNLEKFSEKLDNKLCKKNYQDVKCTIHYGCFHDQEKFGEGLAGMVKALKEFQEKAVGWADLLKSGAPTRVSDNATMFVIEGIKYEKKGFFSNFVNNKESSSTVPKAVFNNSSDVDGNQDSFVVIAAESDQMYHMRMTLQSDQLEVEGDSDIESLTSDTFRQFPETSYEQFEKLFTIQRRYDKALTKLHEFFDSKRFMSENREAEGNEILHKINTIHLQVKEMIRKLDMIDMPLKEDVDKLFQADPLCTVQSYIEDVMFKLPPGKDLDLLIIGKTGHGKSSTGNTILGKEKFFTSASGESVTQSCCADWGDVDGRTIKVIDTPGVCDTSDEKDTIDVAIHSISEAISQCPGGFHALLLVFRFGQRMTLEERKAIGMLKCILGENVIQSHCICVITHGDNFEVEMQSKSNSDKSFLQWCKQQGGYLKHIFEECNYRCVLFNNKEKDPKRGKGQLIELVAKVDALIAAGNGARYTNTLFEFAQQQRMKIVSEEKVPHFSEEMMRDIGLVLDNLKRAAKNSENQEKYLEELENLKGMVENLSDCVKENDDGQCKKLVERVFSLSTTIHGEINKIADRTMADTPDCGAEGSTNNQPSNLEKETEEMQKIYNQKKEEGKKVEEEVTKNIEHKIKEENNCFPAESKVVLKNGQFKFLKDLAVGDEVLVREENGTLCFDVVYMFGHRDFKSVGEFLIFEVDNYQMKVSSCHLVFCVRNGIEICIPARSIKVGDTLIVSGKDGFDYKRVVGFTHKKLRGLFAPFTNCGTIVVDGVLASCYVDVFPHSTSHALLLPMRQIYRFSPSLLAILNGSGNKKKIPLWAKFALKFLQFFKPFPPDKRICH